MLSSFFSFVVFPFNCCCSWICLSFYSFYLCIWMSS